MSIEEIAREQAYISMLYERLDELRTRISTRLSRVLRETETTRQAQARTERDEAAAMYAGRLAQVDAAEAGLCFGRLDFRSGERRYIGRIGIVDESADYEPLLVDWRAPAARPFYVATAISPEGVSRRRHVRTRGREVAGLDDEVLDAPGTGGTQHEELTGEAALLAALNAGRTGRMGDIVETIQGEQDRVIRASHRGTLVVQGGPGTGKTVVALHRAAYLLYTYRELLAKRGILVVGPNTTFLRYIEDVLPSLGETGVLLSTIGELYPGVSAGRAELPEAAAVKGSAAMVDVVAAAVHDRERVPDHVKEIDSEQGALQLDRETCARARQRARQSRLLHNQARPIFVREVIDALARQVADRLGADPYADDPLGGDDAPGEGANLLDDEDTSVIRREMYADRRVQAALDELWPALTPQRLLDDLFSSKERLTAAAPQLTGTQRDLLLRAPGGGWTVADVPLLDEAAERLGQDEEAELALARRQREAPMAYAQGVLDIAVGSRSTDLDVDDEPEMLTAADVVDADLLAERHVEPDMRTTAERAAADRTWGFGHVIVDEAQELSEMAWRMVMRRCPTRSMTVVGDIAQTGDSAGASSWHAMLGPHLGDRWKLARLTLNYRTPVEIMAVADDVLAELDGAYETPRSVRETGVEPWRIEVEADELSSRLGAITAAEAEEMGGGRLAVIVPTSRLEELGLAVAAAVSAVAVGNDPELRSPVVVLDVEHAKGLEFDIVLVADPARIVAESPRGLNDLYVSLTRSTQRLGVVHSAEPPAVLSRLRPRSGS